jgi:hypothetical protein
MGSNSWLNNHKNQKPLNTTIARNDQFLHG